MFARIARLCRSTKTVAPAATRPAAAPASAMYEPLEDRRLCSATPTVSSFSWGANQTGSYGLLLPAVQPSSTTSITDGTSNTLLLPAVKTGTAPTSTNIIAVLIGL